MPTLDKSQQVIVAVLEERLNTMRDDMAIRFDRGDKKFCQIQDKLDKINDNIININLTGCIPGKKIFGQVKQNTIFRKVTYTIVGLVSIFGGIKLVTAIVKYFNGG